MKECFKCKIYKPLSDFYKHSKMSDGHLNKCKECTKKDSHTHRQDNLDSVREYDRNRPNKEERNEENRARYRNKFPRPKRLLALDERFTGRDVTPRQKWLECNPMKRKAQSAANNALRDGKIERKYACESCGCGGKLHKHHWSYDEENWLDITWLCQACHNKEHARLLKLNSDPDWQ